MDTQLIQNLLREALALHQSRNFAPAEQLYRQILQYQPGHADALQLLGTLFSQTNRNEQAAEYISRAIAIAPNISDWHSNLGGALRSLGRTSEAAAALKRAVELKPDSAVAHYNYANTLAELRRTDEAIAEFRRSLEIRPNSAECWNNLGIALKDRDILQAVECFRKSAQINPDYDDAWSNFLLGLHYRQDDPAKVFAEHVEWGRRREVGRGEVGKWGSDGVKSLSSPHPNDPTSPHSRLRIGYVSGDFRDHSVAYFSSSFLREHDHVRFEIFCYDNTKNHDQMTATLKGYSDHWRRIAGVPDQAAEKMIRDDQIDILVDLSGHSGGNRLPLFALKPAPVQVTFLGYPNTTGLPTMGFRLTDEIADPIGLTDALNVERLIRLPRTAWCYTPSPHAPPVNPLPAQQSGYVTFASFNNLAKVTPEMLGVWARIMIGVANSRLLIKADGLHDPTTRQIILAPLLRAGVSANRIELLPRAPSTVAHLSTYHRADIGLDTFPYHGTTSTCEAFWMGLPVVTLMGNSHVSRVGGSLLTNIGLSNLVANSMEEYVQIATDLANDVPRLASIRHGMRDRLMRSPLMDAPTFTRNLEQVFGRMWQEVSKQDCG